MCYGYRAQHWQPNQFDVFDINRRCLSPILQTISSMIGGYRAMAVRYDLYVTSTRAYRMCQRIKSINDHAPAAPHPVPAGRAIEMRLSHTHTFCRLLQVELLVSPMRSPTQRFPHPTISILCAVRHLYQSVLCAHCVQIVCQRKMSRVIRSCGCVCVRVSACFLLCKWFVRLCAFPYSIIIFNSILYCIIFLFADIAAKNKNNQ